MYKFAKYFGRASLALALSSSLTACQPKAEPVPPTAKQQASLERLHKNCILPASLNRRNKGHLVNLAVMRKQKFDFTCDEMKQICESDYASEMCASMMLVASVENAMQRTCRALKDRQTSPECTKVRMGCNGKGFTSQECRSAIARYNR